MINYLTNIIVFICCSLPLYTYYQSLRYWGHRFDS